MTKALGNEQYLVDSCVSNISNSCDCIQDDGFFKNYYPQIWISGLKVGNIEDLEVQVTANKNIYPENKYEIVLQTNVPLSFITSLDKEIMYRIIILEKIKKEVEPMNEKQKILNDIEEAQRKLDEARKN